MPVPRSAFRVPLSSNSSSVLIALHFTFKPSIFVHLSCLNSVLNLSILSFTTAFLHPFIEQYPYSVYSYHSFVHGHFLSYSIASVYLEHTNHQLRTSIELLSILLSAHTLVVSIFMLITRPLITGVPCLDIFPNLMLSHYPLFSDFWLLRTGTG